MKKKVLGMVILLGMLTGCAGNIKEGVLLLEDAKYEDAIAIFEQDIEKERNLDEAYRGIGIAYFELGEYEKSADSFEAALEYGAEETATLCGLLGACYMNMEEYEKALDVYTNALAKKDLTKELKQEMEFNLIAIYEYTGNWEAAKEQIEQYVEDYPEDTRVDKEADFLETR